MNYLVFGPNMSDKEFDHLLEKDSQKLNDLERRIEANRKVAQALLDASDPKDRALDYLEKMRNEEADEALLSECSEEQIQYLIGDPNKW